MTGNGRDDIDVLYDYRVEHPNGAIEEVFIARVPATEVYPEGLSYRMNYTRPNTDEPLVRFDNGHKHGEHHKHTPNGRETVEFEGIEPLMKSFQTTIDDYERTH